MASSSHDSKGQGQGASSRLDRVVTIYACPAGGCRSFFGLDDPDSPDGDYGWNPDGWPHCPTHHRPMRPVKVQAVAEDPINHSAGCFYGSFTGAYDDRWHIPFGADCKLHHGEDPIQLGKPGSVSSEDTGGAER